MAKSGETQRTPNSVVEDQATKAAKKAVAWLVKKLLLRNGIPPGVAGPLSHYYDDHAKIFMRLVFIQLKYNPQWAKLTEQRHAVENFVKQTEELMHETKMPNIMGFKSRMAMAPLLGSDALTAATKEMNEFYKHVRDIVSSLDVQLAQMRTISQLAARSVDQTRKFLGINAPKDNLELVLGSGTLATAQQDLCFSAQALVRSNLRLEEHRNQWASLIGLPQVRRTRSKINWEDKCEMPF